jgi:hypothetical protein
MFFLSDGPPACSTKLMATEVYIKPNDYLDVDCSVNYSGNWAPTVLCLPNITDRNETRHGNLSERVNHTFRQRLQALENTKNINLICTTYFDTVGFHPVHITGSEMNHTPAGNNPNYTFIWTLNVPIFCEYKRL